MLFSVIIPTYNSDHFIEKCIDSILQQSINNYEIIVVDDGNIDNTNNIIKNYQKDNPNIKLIKNKGKGVSSARNIGVTKSMGEYIIFIDSDDYIDKDLFTTLYPYCQKGIDCIKYNAVYKDGAFDPNDDRFICSPFEELTGEEALSKFCKEQKIFATPWMYAIKRDIYINNNLIFPENMVHEDVAIFPLAILFSKTVTSLNFVGYTYVQHKNSIMNNRTYEKKLERAYHFLAHYDYLHSRVDNANVKNETRQIFYNYLSKRINCKIDHLIGEDKYEFIKELERRNVDSWILDGEKIAKKYK